MDDKTLLRRIRACLSQSSGADVPEQAWEENGVAELTPLAGDGSNRFFYRYRFSGFSCVAALPGNQEPRSLSEARAAFKIGRHLHHLGGLVPAVYGHDAETGMVLYEDLGTLHLYDHVRNYREQGANEETIADIYKRAIDALLFLQVNGRHGFQVNWCWDTPHYDRELMIRRESEYFYTQCWRKFLGQEDVDGIEKDFALLADTASLSDNRFFLHRDFQSRNIMLVQGEVRIIDFQGGRFGPMGYDLASLLHDPYVQLSAPLIQALFSYYVEKAESFEGFNRDNFVASYRALAIQRNLQIVGAFCYLGLVCGKAFFRPFIRPSLQFLHYQLAADDTMKLPALKRTVIQAVELLPDTI